MREYKVYKKIRQKASILGMPATNFWVMVILDCLFFAVLIFGFTFLKLLVISILITLNYLFCRYLFNIELLGNISIRDYYRNNHK